MTSVLSRYKGSLVGGVVGDCIGQVFESLWSGPIAIEKVMTKSVEKVEAAARNDSNKKQTKLWKYTDDTAMARSVVKSLIENDGLNSKDMARRFTDEFHAAMDRGYGGGVISVFKQLKENNCEDIFGPASKQFDGQGSFGNGGAMRISPAALFAHHKNMDFNQMKDMVLDITRLTHTHQGALHGTVLQCYAVYLATVTDKLDIDKYIDELKCKMEQLEGKPNNSSSIQKVDVKDEMGLQKDAETNDSDSFAEETDSIEKTMPYCYKLERMRALVHQEEEPSPDIVVSELGTDIAALDSVPAAIYSFLRATKNINGLQYRNPLERTVIYAISLGGDTDTIATMAGSIAGAYYGFEAIPAAWCNCCEGACDAIKDAENLLKLA